MIFEMVTVRTYPADELAELQQPLDEEAQLKEGVTQHVETRTLEIGTLDDDELEIPVCLPVGTPVLPSLLNVPYSPLSGL